MAIRKMKPTTDGQRGMSRIVAPFLSKPKKRIRSLVSNIKKVTGRSNGTITIRHRGGGTRSQYRAVDFDGTSKLGIPGRVGAIEYDPMRTSFICLVIYPDGERHYVIAHKDVKVGDEIVTDMKAKAKDGNRMQLKNIPVGFSIFNIEINAGKGGQIVRSAGQSARLVSLDGDKAQVQLPSGEIRLVEKTNYATIGIISNEEHSLVKLGKAGRVRHMGRRPQVRGKAMNPCDHPHGGGEGNVSIGMKHPKTPWGAPALGVKTRKNKTTDKYIAVSRHRAKK